MRRLLPVLILSLLPLLLAASRVQMLIYRDPGFQGDWGNTEKSQCTIIVNNSSDQQLVDYQLSFQLPSSLVGTSFKILDSEGQELPYCFEQPSGECGTARTNIVWFKAPTIPPGTSCFRVVSGEGSPVNGDGVFDFYDDFAGPLVDLNKWAMSINGCVVIENGWAVVRCGGGGIDCALITKTRFYPDREIRTKVYTDPNSVSGSKYDGNAVRARPEGGSPQINFLQNNYRYSNTAYVLYYYNGSWFQYRVGPRGEYTVVFKFYETHSEICASDMCFSPANPVWPAIINYINWDEDPVRFLRIDYIRARKIASPEPEVIVR